MAARSRAEEIEERIKKIQQVNAWRQEDIESRQREIAIRQSALLDPSTSEGRRARLEGYVQVWKGNIQDFNADIAKLNSEMAELMEERAAISGKVLSSPASASDASKSPSGSVPAGPSTSATPQTPSESVPAGPSTSATPQTPSRSVPAPSTSATPQTPSDLLHQNEYLPGVILSQPLKKARVTSKGKEIYLEKEIGASLSIPRNSIDSEVEVGLAAGFSGSHELPEDMQPVSPAYVVTANRPVELSNDMTLRMQHAAVNTTDMALVEAGITASQDRCVLRRSMKAIEHKHRFGVVKVKKLASTVYRLVKPKRSKEDKHEVVEEEKFYSARLYKVTLEFKVAAVFCVCQEHPIYTTHCDKAIARYYPDLFNKAEEAKGTFINALIFTSDSVAVVKSERTTWIVTMDRSKISRLEVDSPERYKVELSELRDYPPRIILDLMPPAPFSPPANLVVQGLKEPCSFTILTPVKDSSETPQCKGSPARRQETMSVNIAEFDDATEGFQSKIFTKQYSPLVLLAISMAGIMAEVKPLLYDHEHVNDLVKKVQEIEGLIKSVVALTEGAKNVQGSVAKVSMISHQFKKVAPAMLKSSGGDPEMWEGAVDVLVGNSVNLMHSIEELIKDAEVAAVVSRARTKDGWQPGCFPASRAAKIECRVLVECHDTLVTGLEASFLSLSHKCFGKGLHLQEYSGAELNQ